MASVTITASLIGGVNISKHTAIRRCSPIVAKASSSSNVEQAKLSCNNDSMKAEESNSNGRRDLMFAAAAAAACSLAGVAFADEPKRGSPEAKKVYAPVCVTMPTARICRN